MRVRDLRGGAGIAALALPVLAGCPGGDPEDLCLESGTICTVAGTGEPGYFGDGGDARDAMFYWPMDVVVQPGTGNYVVTDWNNHRLRRVLEDGVIETIIGTPLPGDGDEGLTDRDAPGAPGTTVALNHPVQAEFDPATGMLYLPAWHNHKIRTWDPGTGLVVVVGGDTTFDDGNGANAGFAGDGGPAEDALLFFPNSIAFGPGGEYYLVDQKNLRVREIDAEGTISTVAGAGTFGFDSGTAELLVASFAFVDSTTNGQPMPGGSVEAAEDGTLYVADSYNHCIRRVDFATGEVTALAGMGTAGYSGDGGPALAASLNLPKDVELGPDGRLYVADAGNHVIRAIDLEAGTIETVAGTGQQGVGEDGVAATAAALDQPHGIDFAEDGALLIADTFNHRILRVTP